jgi:hypothetical protein
MLKYDGEIKNDLFEAILPRKVTKDIVLLSVPITDTSSQGENPKASETTIAKELGKMTP